MYDGGQLGLLKFPVTRERPPYEVLYSQLGLSKLVEYIQLGLLKHDSIITMKVCILCQLISGNKVFIAFVYNLFDFLVHLLVIYHLHCFANIVSHICINSANDL